MIFSSLILLLFFQGHDLFWQRADPRHGVSNQITQLKFPRKCRRGIHLLWKTCWHIKVKLFIILKISIVRILSKLPCVPPRTGFEFYAIEVLFWCRSNERALNVFSYVTLHRVSRAKGPWPEWVDICQHNFNFYA